MIGYIKKKVTSISRSSALSVSIMKSKKLKGSRPDYMSTANQYYQRK